VANKHKFGALAVTAVAILTLAGSTIASAASPVTHAKRDSAAAPALVAVPSPNGNFQDNFNPFSTSVNYGTVGMVYEPLFYFILMKIRKLLGMRPHSGRCRGI
jgi:peptide/nickel transport system substrate-binding protein